MYGSKIIRFALVLTAVLVVVLLVVAAIGLGLLADPMVDKLPLEDSLKLLPK